MVLSADGGFIVDESDDNTVKICMQEWRKECTFTGDIGEVALAAVSADGTFIVSGHTS